MWWLWLLRPIAAIGVAWVIIAIDPRSVIMWAFGVAIGLGVMGRGR